LFGITGLNWKPKEVTFFSRITWACVNPEQIPQAISMQKNGILINLIRHTEHLSKAKYFLGNKKCVPEKEIGTLSGCLPRMPALASALRTRDVSEKLNLIAERIAEVQEKQLLYRYRKAVSFRALSG
jgi:hypothetical protein